MVSRTTGSKERATGEQHECECARSSACEIHPPSACVARLSLRVLLDLFFYRGNKREPLSPFFSSMEVVGHCTICGKDILERSWAQRRHSLCHAHLCLERTKARYHNDVQYKKDRQRYGRDYYHRKKKTRLFEGGRRSDDDVCSCVVE